MPKTQHLFTMTRGLLWIAIFLALGLIAILALGLGALVLAMMGIVNLPIPANEIHGIPPVQIFGIGTLALALGMICIALVAWMFLLMARIVDTASAGDPFVTANADRLSLIGWVLVAIIAVQCVGQSTVTHLMERMAAEHHLPAGAIGSFSLDSWASPVALLAILLIFVLAQIFRRGSEMRAELEGTV
ncbi:MAG TPA: DUF2975 domain-containing protein [Rhizomicrobium sp.]|nr:DUF2975 domain-containing protein [Rhizomicrobium sp.]